MEIILIRQIIQMFVLSGIGWILFRTGKVNQDGSRILGNILIYVSIPAVIISSFLEEKTPESLSGFLWSVVLAVVLLLAAASPVGSNVAVYAQLYGRDSAYAVEAVVVSTLLSVITVPAVVFFAKVIW